MEAGIRPRLEKVNALQGLACERGALLGKQVGGRVGGQGEGEGKMNGKMDQGTCGDGKGWLFYKRKNIGLYFSALYWDNFIHMKQIDQSSFI